MAQNYTHVDKVVRVLLHDGWHQVADKSFDVSFWSITLRDGIVMQISHDRAGGSELSYSFTDTKGRHFRGPMSAVYGVEEA